MPEKPKVVVTKQQPPKPIKLDAVIPKPWAEHGREVDQELIRIQNAIWVYLGQVRELEVRRDSLLGHMKQSARPIVDSLQSTGLEPGCNIEWTEQNRQIMVLNGTPTNPGPQEK